MVVEVGVKFHFIKIVWLNFLIYIIEIRRNDNKKIVLYWPHNPDAIITQQFQLISKNKS